jgi:hypothetical protein
LNSSDRNMGAFEERCSSGLHSTAYNALRGGGRWGGGGSGGRERLHQPHSPHQIQSANGPHQIQGSGTARHPPPAHTHPPPSPPRPAHL